jgi:hypothetical protein
LLLCCGHGHQTTAAFRNLGPWPGAVSDRRCGGLREMRANHGERPGVGLEPLAAGARAAGGMHGAERYLLDVCVSGGRDA